MPVSRRSLSRSYFILACPLLVAVGLLLVLWAAVNALEPPTITAVAPASGPIDAQTAIVITGSGFISTSTATLGDQPLVGLTFVSSARLEGRVPFGLPSGSYTLTVTGSGSASLPNAFAIPPGAGRWASGGPYGGRTRGIAMNPVLTDTLFVYAEQAGLFRTTDGGRHWDFVLANRNNQSLGIQIWPVDPSVVFAGGEDSTTGRSGLYRSAAGGAAGTWSRVPLIDGISGADSLAIAASQPYTLYLAAANRVLYSSDGGQTWEDRSPLPSLSCANKRLAVDPLAAGTVYGWEQENGVLCKTTDAGWSWQVLPFTMPTVDGQGGIWSLAPDPYRAGTVWLGTWQKGLYRSGDGGQTFNLVDPVNIFPFGPVAGLTLITFDPNGDHIFVGGYGPDDNVYRSDDGGATWQGVVPNNGGGQDLVVAPGDSNLLYTTMVGVRKSTNGGQTWTPVNNGLTAIQVAQLAVSPQDPRRALATADDGAFGTTSAGNEWNAQVLPGWESSGASAAAFDPQDPDSAYLGTNSAVFHTSDGGGQWQRLGDLPLTGLPATHEGQKVQSLAVNPLTSTILYAGVIFYSKQAGVMLNDGGVYKSTDGGAHWALLASNEMTRSVGSLALAPSQPDLIYVGTGVGCHWCTGRGVWRSSDGGQTWAPTGDIDDGQVKVLALAVSPSNPAHLLAGVFDNDSNQGIGVYYSDDGGDSWHQAGGLTTSDEQSVPGLAFNPANPRMALAATQGGLRISLDGGRHWSAYGGSLGQLPATAVAFSAGGQFIYVGTVGGTSQVSRAAAVAGRAAASELVKAGVYWNRVAWHDLYLPLVRR